MEDFKLVYCRCLNKYIQCNTCLRMQTDHEHNQKKSKNLKSNAYCWKSSWPIDGKLALSILTIPWADCERSKPRVFTLPLLSKASHFTASWCTVAGTIREVDKNTSSYPLVSSPPGRFISEGDALVTLIRTRRITRGHDTVW